MLQLFTVYNALIRRLGRTRDQKAPILIMKKKRENRRIAFNDYPSGQTTKHQINFQKRTDTREDKVDTNDDESKRTTHTR